MQPTADPVGPSAETTPPIDFANEPESEIAAREKAYGLWPNAEDGLVYQERLRSEWEDQVDE